MRQVLGPGSEQPREVRQVLDKAGRRLLAGKRVSPARLRAGARSRTTGSPGRALVVIVGAIAELEHNLIIEQVRAGMRRARLEGRRIGRQPLERPASIQRADEVRALLQEAGFEQKCSSPGTYVIRIT
jgi:DNA invertase Pin-like site-specific DNA recombinase